MDVEVIIPSREEGVIEEGLCRITEKLHKCGYDISVGFLGGEFGYGGYIDNDVFMMHPYCWCEKEDCPWCAGCSCPESAFHYFIDGVECSYEKWDLFFKENVPDSFPHDEWMKLADAINKRRTTSQDKVCGYCQEKIGHAPNFHHKKSGLKINWYKYIGRDMELNIVPTLTEWAKIEEECLESIKSQQSKGG